MYDSNALWNGPNRNPHEGLIQPPERIEFKGFHRRFNDLSRNDLDAIGYNEAILVVRKEHTIYTTRWEKGDDYIYREVIVSETEDTTAKRQVEQASARAMRDTLLADTDWTQLKDTSLDDQAMVHWQGYRQALRDVPQQAGFPLAVEWPEMPRIE